MATLTHIWEDDHGIGDKMLMVKLLVIDRGIAISLLDAIEVLR